MKHNEVNMEKMLDYLSAIFLLLALVYIYHYIIIERNPLILIMAAILLLASLIIYIPLKMRWVK